MGPLALPPHHLVTHAPILGMTGSGKTALPRQGDRLGGGRREADHDHRGQRGGGDGRRRAPLATVAATQAVPAASFAPAGALPTPPAATDLDTPFSVDGA